MYLSRHGQRRHRELVLAIEVQAGATGDQHAQSFANVQQGAHYRRSRQQVLEVVEDDGSVALPKELGYGVHQRLRRDFADTQRLSDRQQHQTGILQRRQVDPRQRTVGTSSQRVRDLEGDAGLA